MTKLKQLLPLFGFVLMLCITAAAQENYHLHITPVDKDTTFLQTIGLQTKFDSRLACQDYVSKLPTQLQARGFVTASIDSVHFDSAFATMSLYLGSVYQWHKLNTSSIDPDILTIAGWKERGFSSEPLDIHKVQAMQEKILSHLENNGYPFAKVYLDSMSIVDEKVSGTLKVDKGPVYKIDSIRVYGDVKVSNNFLQRYLDIQKGSVYDKSKLVRISSRLLELPYLEEERVSNVSMHATGSVLNLYLKPKRASIFNVLVGFLPNNDQLSSKKNTDHW